ncbi:unnamed protein product [Hermetia illucens]|uniref:Uncharacterized protein n=2 Tax=Hermetia illucens TaxID=343691 RepID=A0A7R8Z0G0_HERIL|nr:unnamed protein product [Hermetia illucens]
MKITVAVGKAVIATYPTGHNLSLELSVYYPLPTKLEEWYPRRYRERLKMATKKPMVPPKMPMSVKNSLISRIDHDRIYYEGGASYIPGTHWANRAPVLYSAPKYSADRVWINKDYNKFRKRLPFSRNPSFPESIKWGQYLTKEWKPTTQKYRKPIPVKNMLSNYRFAHKFDDNDRSRVSFDEQYLFENNKNFERYYRAHKDRRDLYNYIEQIGKNYGFDLKACILRAICESKRYLLPMGHSLIQDIIRIAFTLPSDRSILDEYSKTQESQECEGAFDERCPFSIIDMALNPDKMK